MSTTVPDVTFVPVNPTAYDAPEPVKEVIDQPVLVPLSEISDCKRSVTDSLNCRLYVNCVAWFDGDVTVAANEDTAGFNIVSTTKPLPVREP